jgi:hypothetical protein
MVIFPILVNRLTDEFYFYFNNIEVDYVKKAICPTQHNRGDDLFRSQRAAA